MRKNKISKIALLTGLLMINTNVKGFYQCVPKKDWFKNQYDILMLEDKFKVAKTLIDNEHAWELVIENKTSGSLNVGVYRVVLAGGQGGSVPQCLSGIGGLGQIKKEVFLLTSTTSFNATIGNKGKDVSWKKTATDGEKSSFSCNNNSFTSDFGGGAFFVECKTGKWEGKEFTICHCGNNKSYSSGNSGNGYVKIYKYIG